MKEERRGQEEVCVFPIRDPLEAILLLML